MAAKHVAGVPLLRFEDGSILMLRLQYATIFARRVGAVPNCIARHAVRFGNAVGITGNDMKANCPR